MLKRAKNIGNDFVFDLFNYFILTIVIVCVLYPIIYILSASFSSPQDVIAGKVWFFPVNFTLMGYEAVFRQPLIWSGYFNSLFYASVGTIVSVVLTVMAGYPLSRKDLFGRNLIMGLFVFTIMFSGGLIPYYLLVKSLGMIDTRLAMILPSAMSIWNVIITRTYFQTTIPEELNEASQLDGCSDIQFIISVVMPLSIPILAVNSLFFAVSKWNSYFDAIIFLKTDSLFPLQIVLRNVLILSQIDNRALANVSTLILAQGLKELVKYSLIVVASAPLLIIYPFVQKYFIKGLMVGAIKG